ncbi:MAG: hypothetical protein H7122_17715 [Chitinophagaceae bacterium]|nr:hypothetical protein [Chitinophagaceae bacterium]
MNLKYPIIFLGALLIAISVRAQQFGGNPPSVKWQQVNTDTVRIIFPSGLALQAQQVAAISHDLSLKTAHSIGSRIRKINIVLQNQTTISNGYVGLGPYRSEFQLTPDANSFALGSLPWLQSLAIHEYRHVQQYNNFRKGIASGFYILFGEEGQALANALTVPDWFFEGDAVYQETQVSGQGRGRLPYFFNGYRSLWSAGRNYSYMKLRNGSLRDFVPGHYPLGYMLVAYGREKYGQDFWKRVTADAAAWNGLFYPFQKAIGKYSGKSFRAFREDAFRFFNTQPISDVGLRKHFIADQEFPYWIDTASIVYLNTSYRSIPRFVIRTNSSEKKIRTRDVSIDNYFSFRNGKIVYAAYKPDIRWGWRDYSELKLLNVQTGIQKKLTRRTKYFSPDLSEDGRNIVAVHVDTKGNSALHLLNGNNGSLEKKIPNPEGLFYTYPKFYSKNEVVSAVRNKDGKMSIAVVDLNNGSTKYILPFSWSVIGFPAIDKNSIYFTLSYDGTDKIFRWENDRLYIVQETVKNPHNTGDYQVTVLNDKLAWTRFTASGYRLMFSQKNKTAADTPASQFLPDQPNFGIQSVSDSLNQFLSDVKTRNYKITNYQKSFRLFNFHSRRPYVNDPDYSFSFVSENILNTMQSEVFLNYNRNEQYKQVGFSVLYGALFPVLKLGTQFTFDRNARLRTNAPRIYWNEWETNLGFSIPLNLSNGRTFTYLTTGSDYVYNKRYLTGYYKDSFENRAFGYINASLNFSNQIQKARQHIYPRFAQTVLVNYKKAVTNLEGSQFLVSGNLYLPGISNNHSLVLQAAWHRRDTLNDIRFSNSFPFSRGYATNNFHQMWKAGANYHLPLAYPDWGFGNIIYFLRIRGNLFYDYTQIADYNSAAKVVRLNFRSFGTEIFFDTKWWNQYSVSFGIRYSRLIDQDLEGRTANQFEIVLPVNLLNR